MYLNLILREIIAKCNFKQSVNLLGFLSLKCTHRNIHNIRGAAVYFWAFSLIRAWNSKYLDMIWSEAPVRLWEPWIIHSFPIHPVFLETSTTKIEKPASASYNTNQYTVSLYTKTLHVCCFLLISAIMLPCTFPMILHSRPQSQSDPPQSRPLDFEGVQTCPRIHGGS